VTSNDHTADAERLIDFLREKIPQALAMDLRLGKANEYMLSLAAPLTPNINDKGCAFGGSLSSVMTLSGWALVELALRQRGEDCDVFVAESSVRYLAPVWRDFHSEAQLSPEAHWDTFFTTLEARGRARISVSCMVPGEDGAPAATLNARFVAKRRHAAPIHADA